MLDSPSAMLIRYIDVDGPIFALHRDDLQDAEIVWAVADIGGFTGAPSRG
jgi:hypothetical protein